MNVYDSEQIVKLMESTGYKTVPFPETADLIITNTCSIREKSEQKALSFLGRLASLKRKNKDLIVGIAGCVAQQEGNKILHKIPHVDFVLGTHAISRLPDIIKKIKTKKCRIVDIEMTLSADEIVTKADSCKNNKVSAFVTIMRGCDNFCTYCVVPYVRGRETSRNPESIVREIDSLANNGVKEVTLLGQNVNSYGKTNKLCSFSDLLCLVNEIDGLARIRFTTSHPKDLSEDLMRKFSELDKLCKHIHLPVQSGSNKILKRMNRKYSKELYLEKVEKLRKICPNIAISSDFIVGFPGETEADFQETLDLINKVRYDSVFAFKYSDRPNVPAAGFDNKISETEKNLRLQELLGLQKNITTEKNRALVGSNQLVLVEGFSKKQSKADLKIKRQDIQWTGRTSKNYIVNFISKDNNIYSNKIDKGKIITVKIFKSFPHSLWGKQTHYKIKSSCSKGENTYAA